MESQERIWDDVAAGLKAAVQRERDIEAAQDEMRRVRAQEDADDAHVDSVTYEYVSAKPRTREDMDGERTMSNPYEQTGPYSMDIALQVFHDELNGQDAMDEPVERTTVRQYVMRMIVKELADRERSRKALKEYGTFMEGAH